MTGSPSFHGLSAKISASVRPSNARIRAALVVANAMLKSSV
jgi:hypothetical protein